MPGGPREDRAPAAELRRLLGILGPRILSRISGLDRAPRLGILAWQALSIAALGSVVLAGIALMIPTVPVSTSLTDLLQACVMALRAQYATPQGATLGAIGGLVVTAALVRSLSCFTVVLARAAAERKRQRDVLAVIGRIDRRLDAVIVEHEQAVAYCLPGRHQRVVLSTAALAALDADQLRAVLAHERAHLRGRHDLLIAAVAALADAFPHVPLFAAAQAHVARLIELRADDVAHQATERLTLAEALLALAASPTPAPALGAAGSTTAARIHRLIQPHHPLGHTRTALAGISAAAMLVAPMLMLTPCPLVTAASIKHSSEP